MEFHTIPVRKYVERIFSHPRVTKITSSWRVEPERLRVIVCDVFQEMGIYQIVPSQQTAALEHTIKILKTSKDIKAMLKKIEQEELEKKRSRHAEI